MPSPSINVIVKAQMQLRDERAWTLRDLLGLAGEPPTAAAPKKNEDPDIDDPAAWCMTVQQPWPPSLVGNTWPFGAVGEFGMPKWLPPPTAAALRRSIVNARVGAHPLLDWIPPMRAASQLKLTLVDLQQLPGAATRLVKVTLRALPFFQGTPTRDYVTLDVAGDGHDRTHFGRCVCFFKDSVDRQAFRGRALADRGRRRRGGPRNQASAVNAIEARTHGQLQCHARLRNC